MYAEIKQNNGKSQGFGSVRFETPVQAQTAADLFNGVDIDGRKIEVHMDSRRKWVLRTKWDAFLAASFSV